MRQVLKILTITLFFAPLTESLACEKTLCKIVFSGAPSSGKSTSTETLAKKSSDTILVPEVGTLLLEGGHPTPQNEEQQIMFQRTIALLQNQIEETYRLQNKSSAIMVIDRGTLDGYGFWSGDKSSYLKAVGFDEAKELNAYDWIIFFEIPDQANYGGNNPNRFHNHAQSVLIGEKLKEIWSSHPRFLVIPSFPNFQTKVDLAVKVVELIQEGKSKTEINSLIDASSTPQE